MSTSAPAPTTNTSSTTDLTIPKACVKRIMKLNDEVSNVSAESVIATTKAAELFLMDFVENCKNEALLNNRKTIKVDDILNTIENNQVRFEFLNDAFAIKTNNK